MARTTSATHAELIKPSETNNGEAMTSCSGLANTMRKQPLLGLHCSDAGCSGWFGPPPTQPVCDTRRHEVVCFARYIAHKRTLSACNQAKTCCTTLHSDPGELRDFAFAWSPRSTRAMPRNMVSRARYIVLAIAILLREEIWNPRPQIILGDDQHADITLVHRRILAREVCFNSY